MSMETRREGNAVVMSVNGRLDAVTGPAFQKAVGELVAAGNRRIVLDLATLTYVSSAGVSALLMSSRLLSDKGGELVLANVRPTVGAVLDMCGVRALFPIYGSVAEALG